MCPWSLTVCLSPNLETYSDRHKIFCLAPSKPQGWFAEVYEFARVRSLDGFIPTMPAKSKHPASATSFETSTATFAPSARRPTVPICWARSKSISGHICFLTVDVWSKCADTFQGRCVVSEVFGNKSHHDIDALLVSPCHLKPIVPLGCLLFQPDKKCPHCKNTFACSLEMAVVHRKLPAFAYIDVLVKKFRESIHSLQAQMCKGHPQESLAYPPRESWEVKILALGHHHRTICFLGNGGTDEMAPGYLVQNSDQQCLEKDFNCFSWSSRQFGL